MMLNSFLKVRSLFILIFILLIALNPAKAQDKGFSFNWKKDGLFLFGGTALFGLGQYAKSKVNTLSPEDAMNLDPNNVNAFDRSAIYNNNEKSDQISDYVVAAAVVSPLTSLLSRSVRQDFLPVMFMYLETGTFINGVTNITKGLTHRTRPYVYDPESDLNKTSVAARHSFFSGHVSNATAFSFLTASLVQQYADRKLWKYMAWSGAFVIPATVGYLRYSAGKHFPTDVLTGFVVGAGVGLLMPKLHKKRLPEDTSHHLDFKMGPTGFNLAYRF